LSGPTSDSVFNLKHKNPVISMLVALQLPLHGRWTGGDQRPWRRHFPHSAREMAL